MRFRRVLIAISVLVASGCAGRSPHGVAERYLEYLRQYDYADCYALLSPADRSARSFSEFLTEIPLARDVSPVWFRSVLQRSEYSLGEEVRDGDSAMVPVRITAPDLPLWERELNRAAGAGGVAAEAVRRSLESGSYPKWTFDDRIYLTKVHHRWRLAAGFTARDQVVDRHRLALNDFMALRYDRAIPQWQSMIADLRSQKSTGSAGLAARYQRELTRIDRLRATAPESQVYAAQLKLSDVAMKMSKERVPAIFGKLRNAGDRPVDTLALVVSWYVGHGRDTRAVAHEDHVVVFTPIEFADFTRKVAPFEPGESRAFGFILNAPQSVQQEAAPYVTIGAIALSDSRVSRSKSAIAGRGLTEPVTAATARLDRAADWPG
jgi:hypothetical protein